MNRALSALALLLSATLVDVIGAFCDPFIDMRRRTIARDESLGDPRDLAVDRNRLSAKRAMLASARGSVVTEPRSVSVRLDDLHRAGRDVRFDGCAVSATLRRVGEASCRRTW